VPFDDTSISNEVRQAILRKELETLTANEQEYQRLRSYFDGKQELTFSTEVFHETFGDAFEGFADNWMTPIVDTVLDKMELRGIQPANEEMQNRMQTLWDVFRRNEIDEEQFYLHQGSLVESTAYMIVWPDQSKGGVRFDWQPASLVRVRYSSEDRKRPLWAVKRWEAESGDIYVSIYDDQAVWKFIEKEGSDASLKASSADAYTEIVDSAFLNNMVKREVEGEEWPLRHRFGRVPVVEFPNVGFRSEIADATRQQDAMNKTLVDMMVAGSFMAFPQRYVETAAHAPIGGWNAGAGEVWHFRPGFDADGRPIQSTFGQFDTSDPSNYIKVVEMWLQHIAFTSRTPVRYFMSSDRGGRGDAPSGESLQVEDKPLNDKVARKQKILGNRWVELASMAATYVDGVNPNDLILAEMIWEDPRYENRIAVLEEAKSMVEVGLPFKWIIRQLGLRPEEIEDIERYKDEEVAEQQQRQDEMMERANSQDSDQNSDSGSDDESDDE